jgi:hypothetical protein
MRRLGVLGELRGVHTAPHPRLRASQLFHGLRGPKTLESRILPGAFLVAFLGLLVIQAFHALAH